MERLPEPLGSFRDLIEADLRRAARLIVKVQDELDPQLRVATPTGDWAIAVTLPVTPIAMPTTAASSSAATRCRMFLMMPETVRVSACAAIGVTEPVIALPAAPTR